MILEIELADGRGRLDLDPSLSIEFEQIFNLHDFEHIEGSKSWKFQLPKTPNNRRLTGFVDLPQIRSSFENNIRVRINLQGSLWKVGLLYFINDQPEFWNVHFAGEAGLLKQKLAGKKLRDFTLTHVTGIADPYAHAKTVAEQGPASHDYTFSEVYVPNASNPATVPNYLNSNRFNLSTGDWIGFTAGVSGDYAPLCPFPYVKSVLKTIANELGVTFGGALWEEEEFSRLIFFNTVCLNTIVGEQAKGYPVDEINLNNHVPDIELGKFLINLGKLFNQIITYNDLKGTITFIHRTDLLSTEHNYQLREGIGRFETEYEEKRTYNLNYEYNQEDVDIRKFSGTISDLSGVNGRAGSVEMNADFSTLPMLDYGTTHDVIAISSLDLNDDVPLQLLFYRGFKLYPQSGMPKNPDVPHVSSDLNYTPSTGYTIDKNTLLWKGEKGLYENWWKKYLNTLGLAKVLRAQLVMNAVNIATFNEQQLYALADFICFFEELKLTFSGSKVVAEAQLLKL